MEREEFLKLLAGRFYPLLREEGFRGSGTTLRRLRKPVAHVVNIQGSSSADGFYVNLGAHLLFLPLDSGRVVAPTSLKGYECAFRDRVDPPALMWARRWPYGRTATDAEAVIARLVKEWRRQGQAFFDKYFTFPDDFARLVMAALDAPPHPADGLKYARIALELGLRDEAGALARRSLESCPATASGLRAMLKRFLEEFTTA